MRILSLTCACLLTVSFLSDCQAQLIVAHRGASHDAPENTLAAFRLAWAQQADAIEGDFYLTQDGQIACLHDRTTKRVAPDQPEMEVAKSTLDQLQTLDVGSWKHSRYAGERIPTLRQVLAIVPQGKRIFVEIKCGPEILPELQRQLSGSRLKADQIVIICFNEAVVTQARNLMPQYKASWLTSYKQDTEESPWKPSSEDVVKSLQRTNATGLGTNANMEVVNRLFANTIRNVGLEFHVWTVNDPAAARYFAALGADSITTDRPALIRSTLQPQSDGTP